MRLFTNFIFCAICWLHFICSEKFAFFAAFNYHDMLTSWRGAIAVLQTAPKQEAPCCSKNFGFKQTQKNSTEILLQKLTQKLCKFLQHKLLCRHIIFSCEKQVFLKHFIYLLHKMWRQHEIWTKYFALRWVFLFCFLGWLLRLEDLCEVF